MSTANTTTSSTTDGGIAPLPIPSAPELLWADDQNSKRLYWDRSLYDSINAQKEALAKSSTLYVGNLSFSTRTSHIRSHFSLVGPVQTIHMGLDRIKKTPCGFCFVQYRDRRCALAAVANLSGTKLDGRVIRVELDAGFFPGRQYGRGRSGGQVRDEKRATGRTKGPPGAAAVGDKRERENEEGGDEDEDNFEQSAKRRRL